VARRRSSTSGESSAMSSTSSTKCKYQRGTTTNSTTRFAVESAAAGVHSALPATADPRPFDCAEVVDDAGRPVAVDDNLRSGGIATSHTDLSNTKHRTIRVGRQTTNAPDHSEAPAATEVVRCARDWLLRPDLARPRG